MDDRKSHQESESVGKVMGKPYELEAPTYLQDSLLALD